MPKQFKNERATFPKGEQRKALLDLEKELSIVAMAKTCNCSVRTIRDWRREKFSMNLSCLQKLCAKAQCPIPETMQVRDAYAHTRTAGAKGWCSVKAKYGRVPTNETHRKNAWRIWWNTKGKFENNPILKTKPIYQPKKNSELAELIGIVMGDGGISRYQVVVTLHHIDDYEYSAFVAKLIKKLFHVTPHIRHSPKKSVREIIISRAELVKYLHSLGLPIGNKVAQQFDIPNWIKKNKKLSIACLRGLVDTDGSIFTHRYKVNGKWYSYKKLSFTSLSRPLLQSVAMIMQSIGLHPRISANQNVWLDSKKDMERYLLVIGSHNPKHLKRYKSKVG